MRRKNKTIQIRIDEDTKNKSRDVFESLGLDLSSGIELYLRTVIREGRVPFEIDLRNSRDETIDRTIDSVETSRLDDNSIKKESESKKKGILQRLYGE